MCSRLIVTKLCVCVCLFEACPHCREWLLVSGCLLLWAHSLSLSCSYYRDLSPHWPLQGRWWPPPLSLLFVIVLSKYYWRKTVNNIWPSSPRSLSTPSPSTSPSTASPRWPTLTSPPTLAYARLSTLRLHGNRLRSVAGRAFSSLSFSFYAPLPPRFAGVDPTIVIV